MYHCTQPGKAVRAAGTTVPRRNVGYTSKVLMEWCFAPIFEGMSKVVLIAGATGMVGKRVLERALEQEEISKVIVYGRSSVDFRHPKMEEVLSPIFDQFPVALLDQLPKVDHILFCVGVYTGAVKRELFREITGLPGGLSQETPGGNPSGAFSLLSGQGRPHGEISHDVRYGQGHCRERPQRHGGGRFFSFRPGYIYPVIKRKEPNFSYRLSRSLYPLLKAFGPKYSITSFELAEGILPPRWNIRTAKCWKTTRSWTLSPSLWPGGAPPCPTFRPWPSTTPAKQLY